MNKLEQSLDALELLTEVTVSYANATKNLAKKLREEMYESVKENVMDTLTLDDIIEEFGKYDIIEEIINTNDPRSIFEYYDASDAVEYYGSEILSEFDEYDLKDYVQSNYDVNDWVDVGWNY